MQKLLDLKHWQLFTLAFGIPFLGQIIIMFVVFKRIIDNAIVGNGDPNIVFDIYATLFPLMAIPMLFLVVIYLWQNAIVNKAAEMVEEYSPKMMLYRVCLYFPFAFVIIYFVAFGWFFGALGESMADPASMGPPSEFILSALIFVPIGLLSFVAQVYAILETGRAAKTLIENRRTTYSESAIEIILVWFNFIGVWILQPKFAKARKRDSYLEELS